ncbi:hypothetical protein LOTGIDRAFT_119943, partial [Lottia gigantea]
VLGLDCEWVMDRENNITYPVALLQLATYQGLCILIRLNLMENNIPKSLLKILSDRSILKCGVAVNDDGNKLYKDYGITVSGCVDLRHILPRVRGMYQCKSKGLKGLSEAILGFSIYKDSTIRCGNWEADVLSEKQVKYAALDALVGIDIYTKLVMTKLLGYIPTKKQLETQVYCNHDYFMTSKSLSQGLVDVPYKRNFYDGDSLSQVRNRCHYQTTCSPVVRVGSVGAWPQKTNLTSKKNKVDSLRSYSSRQRPLYHNCQLEAPDGQMLCTCDVKKAQWYIMKDLGYKVKDDPLTVRLKFEPSGRPESENNYYLQFKDNMCVVCGRSESYIRKFIVPQEYRKFFPYHIKAHTSHDVLLLCPSCHQISSQNDSEFRLTLVEECSAPLGAGSSSKSTQDHELQKIKGAAKALVLNKDKIPEKRVEVLESVVKEFFNVEELSDDLLHEAMDMDIRVFNASYVPHAQKVVEYMKKHGGLLEFEKRWRKHFVEKMKPNYLPPFWSVDHTHQQVLKLYGVDA